MEVPAKIRSGSGSY